MDIAAAVRDGISFMTHKVGEARTVTDDRFGEFYTRAKAAGMPLLGGYYVNHGGDQISQADRFLALLDAKAPGWRGGPFILQVDAEKFDYMTRAPTLAEIAAFADRLVARTGGALRPVVYAPRWLYGDTLRGLGYPLWASAYGTNPAVPYRQAYPGDGSTRWAAYSGMTPAILQFGSRTIIGRQPTCDADAFRGSLAQLAAICAPGYAGGPPPPEETDMLVLFADEGRKWVGDGVTRRPVTDQEASDLQYAARVGALKVAVWDGWKDVATPGVFGAIVEAVVSDAQVDRIAAQLIAATDNPLGEADKPAIVAALKQALTEGTA